MKCFRLVVILMLVAVLSAPGSSIARESSETESSLRDRVMSFWGKKPKPEKTQLADFIKSYDIHAALKLFQETKELYRPNYNSSTLKDQPPMASATKEKYIENVRKLQKKIDEELKLSVKLRHFLRLEELELVKYDIDKAYFDLVTDNRYDKAARKVDAADYKYKKCSHFCFRCEQIHYEYGPMWESCRKSGK